MIGDTLAQALWRESQDDDHGPSTRRLLADAARRITGLEGIVSAQFGDHDLAAVRAGNYDTDPDMGLRCT